MSYIKFRIGVRKTDELGNTTRVVISRVESDMADTTMLETNIIMNALSLKGIVQQNVVFILDESRLNLNILG